MNQLFTLTTDFGTRDGYAGAIKGRLLTLCPGASVVDITHDIAPQEIFAAAWAVERATPQFAAGTIHLVVVDPGVGSQRKALLAEANGHWYLAPDNGVLTGILRPEFHPRVLVLHRETRWWRAHSTFDGLAVFAPAAACLAGGVDLTRLGEPLDTPVILDLPKARREEGRLVGTILMFDRFGNAQTNISAKALDASGLTAISCKGVQFTFASHYAAEPERPVALVNSDGYLELAAYRASARDRFQLGIGDEVTIHD